MNRQHIHFAQGLSGDDSVISGMPRTSSVIIFLDVSKALGAGLKFYVSENGVVLTPGNERGLVPTEFFSRVEAAKTGKTLDGFEGPRRPSVQAEASEPANLESPGKQVAVQEKIIPNGGVGAVKSAWPAITTKPAKPDPRLPRPAQAKVAEPANLEGPGKRVAVQEKNDPVGIVDAAESSWPAIATKPAKVDPRLSRPMQAAASEPADLGTRVVVQEKIRPVQPSWAAIRANTAKPDVPLSRPVQAEASEPATLEGRGKHVAVQENIEPVKPSWPITATRAQQLDLPLARPMRAGASEPATLEGPATHVAVQERMNPDGDVYAVESSWSAIAAKAPELVLPTAAALFLLHSVYLYLYRK